uniref:EF-hand domain-containing protein n=1 Tax=Prymnesium polylepis TaxID=72548 RepID=A0A7S4JQX9_9EUKA|mmetsp:Transcript_6086/g.14131  ORF Transcript_6086/g.14131 Transcript_6086/m.14131 type:complete len:368 (+) Transcript_6086:90-1193(+)
MTATITQDMLGNMLLAMQSEDGQVHKENFKIVYTKLHPETTKEEYDKLWEKIDENGDGNLDQQELAHFFGVNYADLAKDMRDKRSSEKAMEEMDDDQILEALQMEQALRDLQAQAAKSRDPSPAVKPPERKNRGKLGSRDEDVKVFKMPTNIKMDEPEVEIQLLQACESNDEAEILRLVEEKVNVRIEDDKGEMPMHKICRHGNIKVVRELLRTAEANQKGSKSKDLNMTDRKGKTPIMIAAEYGQTELVMHLLDLQANLKAEAESGWTIMHFVVNANKPELLQQFLVHKEVNAIKKELLTGIDQDERSAMHIAAFKCDEKIVEILAQNGAKVDQADRAGNNPMALAQRAGRRKSRDIMEAFAGSGP